MTSLSSYRLFANVQHVELDPHCLDLDLEALPCESVDLPPFGFDWMERESGDIRRTLPDKADHDADAATLSEISLLESAIEEKLNVLETYIGIAPKSSNSTHWSAAAPLPVLDRRLYRDEMARAHADLRASLSLIQRDASPIPAVKCVGPSQSIVTAPPAIGAASGKGEAAFNAARPAVMGAPPATESAPPPVLSASQPNQQPQRQSVIGVKKPRGRPRKQKASEPPAAVAAGSLALPGTPNAILAFPMPCQPSAANKPNLKLVSLPRGDSSISLANNTPQPPATVGAHLHHPFTTKHLEELMAAEAVRRRAAMGQ
ncbi:hypothetical protein BC828DRAFT_371692 [Blastocladiella britannica]|nr:hypothetical protein BC828DRAFT_371692 [Blastocladiella britannica]